MFTPVENEVLFNKTFFQIHTHYTIRTYIYLMGIIVNISENSASQFFYEIIILCLFQCCTYFEF